MSRRPGSGGRMRSLLSWGATDSKAQRAQVCSSRTRTGAILSPIRMSLSWHISSLLSQ